MTEAALFRVRVALIQAYLRERGFDGVLLSRTDNYAMATGGKRNYVGTASDVGANALFVDRAGSSYFIGNTIEAPRQMEEELAGLGCEARDFLWFADTPANVVSRSFKGRLVSDDGSVGPNVHQDLAVLRALLTPAEFEKYRRLGRLAAEAMTATIEAIEPGTTEADIAARLVAEGARRRCQVPVALAAADERITRYRHPLPTLAPLLDGRMEERAVRVYAMVVGGFMREGLVVSLTRFRNVGDLPMNVADAYARICAVDARMQEGTRPGQTLGDVFDACRRAYVDFAFPENEWHNHHQGGATGYAGRTCKGKPAEMFPVLDEFWPAKACEILGEAIPFGSAFAWNPSAAGVKSEDTFLLGPDGRQEIITRTEAFPDVDLARALGRPTESVKSDIMPA